jgi:hypothetical protein
LPPPANPKSPSASSSLAPGALENAQLERELERVRREQRIPRSLTFAELVDVYLAQHDVQPVTIEKLRWLLSKATAVFGERRIGELTPQEIAEWRMNLSPGYRFEATQAVRQVLNRAVVWGMLDINPATVGVDNPTPRRKEQHPFESWAELEALAAALGPRYGPMILFAAATGLRPAEWVALEWRDIDREERVVFVRRSFTRGELKLPKDGRQPTRLRGFKMSVSCCGAVVFVDQSAKSVAALDLCAARLRVRACRVGREQRESAVGALAVVVGGVGAEHCLEVAAADDQ